MHNNFYYKNNYTARSHLPSYLAKPASQASYKHWTAPKSESWPCYLNKALLRWLTIFVNNSDAINIDLLQKTIAAFIWAASEDLRWSAARHFYKRLQQSYPSSRSLLFESWNKGSSSINSSLADGYFPENWKEVLVKPLLKRAGLDSVFNNLRPISNLQFISKLAERAVDEQTYDHLILNDLFPEFQSAYRKYRDIVYRI